MDRRRTAISLAFILAFAIALALIGIGIARHLYPQTEATESSDQFAGGSQSSDASSETNGSGRLIDKLTSKGQPKLESLNGDDSSDYQRPVLVLPDWQDNSYIKELIREGNETAERVSKLSKDVQQELRIGLVTAVEKGSGSGSMVITVSAREKRLLRWTMVFNWADGADYVQQLKYFDAIVAVPQRDHPEKYYVVRDVSQRPVRLGNDDLRQIKRIFWIDDRAESVKALCQTIGLKYTPARVVTFFPETLEKQLLQLELDYKGAKEEDILETRFAVRATEKGKYEPVVQSQKLRTSP
jgi:hypothetical protein